MKVRHVLYGLVIAIPAFIAGLLASEFAWAQGKEAASEWSYKVVDIEGARLAAAVKGGEARSLEDWIEKHGDGGWELVSYSAGHNPIQSRATGVAVYRIKAKR